MLALSVPPFWGFVLGDTFFLNCAAVIPCGMIVFVISSHFSHGLLPRRDAHDFLKALLTPTRTGHWTRKMQLESKVHATDLSMNGALT